MEKTHWKKAVSDPNYIGEADFQEGEEKVLTIAKINAAEMVATAKGKSKKAVVHWAEPGNKPMILNVARSKNIEKVAGSGYFEDWIGVKVQLYIEHGIEAFGDIVSAVRVRPYKPRIKQGEEARPILCSACNKPLTTAMGYSPARLAKYTTKKYGMVLCFFCAEQMAAEKTAAAKGERAEEDAPTDLPATGAPDAPPAPPWPAEKEGEE